MAAIGRLPPLNTLISFEAVARRGSMTAAASELHLSQSAISKQIKTLETQLAIPLLQRHARGIVLTAAGASLLDEITPVLDKLRNGVERVRLEHDSTTVNIIATHAVAHYWLFPRVTEFNQHHPEVTVNIHSNNAIHQTNLDDYDFGILYGPGNWPRLHSDPLFAERVYPICHPDLAVNEPDVVERLMNYPLIQLDSRAWDCIDWTAWFAHFGLEYRSPASAATFNQVTLVYHAALEGLGVGLGWDFMVRRAIDTGRLRRLGPFSYISGYYDYLAYSRGRPLKPAAQIFRQWLLANLPDPIDGPDMDS